MHTLQEFLYYTKAIEYIGAVIFVLCFIVFWKVINSRRNLPEDDEIDVEMAKPTTIEPAEDRELDKAA